MMGTKEEVKLWPGVACYRDAVGGCVVGLLWIHPVDECSDSQVVECECQSRAGEGGHCQSWAQTLAFSSCLPSLEAQRPSKRGLEKS